MKKIKEIFEKHPNIIFIGLFLIFFAIHYQMTLSTNDDIYFSSFSISEIPSFLGLRYNEWSSRIIIEAVLIFICNLPQLVWKILNSLILTSISFNISYLFTKNGLKEKILCSAILLLYPIAEMSSAGWIATTLNYLWPLAFGLIALYPIKNALKSKTEKVWMYPIYIISLIFACNQEQMCALILGFYLVFIIYLVKEKKCPKFIFLMLILAICSISIILLCPGNSVRAITETADWNPNFAYYGILKKLFLGVITTGMTMVFKTNILLILFSIILIIALKNHKNFIVKFISAVPLLLLCVFNLFSNVFESIFLGFSDLIANLSYFAGDVQALSINTFSLTAAMITLVLFGSMAISLYFIFKTNKSVDEKIILPIIILLAGFASRVIIGFSPTFYASLLRTFLFLDFTIIILTIIIFLKIDLKQNKWLIALILILVICSFLNNIVLT